MTTKKPGDTLLDRYFPDATHEEREDHREQFARFAEAIFRVGVRLADEEQAASQVPRLHDEASPRSHPLDQQLEDDQGSFAEGRAFEGASSRHVPIS